MTPDLLAPLVPLSPWYPQYIHLIPTLVPRFQSHSKPEEQEKPKDKVLCITSSPKREKAVPVQSPKARPWDNGPVLPQPRAFHSVPLPSGSSSNVSSPAAQSPHPPQRHLSTRLRRLGLYSLHAWASPSESSLDSDSDLFVLGSPGEPLWRNDTRRDWSPSPPASPSPVASEAASENEALED